MDKSFIKSRLRVRKGVVVHVKRIILGYEKRTISVKVGQEVHPEDVLAIGQATAGFRTIHLANNLEVDPKQALTYLKRKIGERIYEGEILAARDDLFGLRKKVLQAPTDGVLDVYDDTRGELKIKLLPQTFKLVSGLYGMVDKIEPTTGSIIIKSLVDIVYGVLGSGQERAGILKIYGNKEQLISSKQLTSNSKGQLIVGGGLVFIDAIEKAISLGVEGIISGGINARDYKSMVGGRWNIRNRKWSDVGVSVMITEGFGSIQIGDDIFSTLQKYDGRFCFLDGNRARIILPSNDQNSMMYVRKTQLPQGSFVESEPSQEMIELNIGITVRVVAGPWIGLSGIIKEIDQVSSLLPSGLSSIMVTIETKQRKLRLPFQNIEAIV